MKILEVSDVSLSFDGVTALREVNFSMGETDLLGIIGPNGSGKTTLFNVISGHYRPDTGRVLLGERDITGLPPWKVARIGIARNFQTPRVFPKLTTRQNLLAACSPKSLVSWLKVPPDARLHSEHWMTQLGLDEMADVLAGELSYGYLRRLEIARACVTKPRVLLLDEPAAGMTGGDIRELTDIIRMLQGERMSIILIEHNMPWVLSLCPRVLVLNFGRLIASGSPQEIQEDPEVKDAYLGQEVVEEDASSAEERPVRPPEAP